MTIDLCNQNLDQKKLEQQVLAQIQSAKEPISGMMLSGNQLKNLDFLNQLIQNGNLPQLKILDVSSNQLSLLNITNAALLLTLDGSNNPLQDVTLTKCSALKSLDLRECGISDKLFVKILQQGRPRYIKLSGNKISDKGVQAALKNKELKETLEKQLSALDLKENPTQFKSILQIRQTFFAKEQETPNAPSRMSSSTFSKGPTEHEDLKSLHSLMKEYQKSGYTWPQALAAVLVGGDHPMVQKCTSMCDQRQVCAVLTIGARSQPDIEDVLGVGFVRKVGTVYCKDTKIGTGMDCKQRCEVVLHTIQKRIEKQQEKRE